MTHPQARPRTMLGILAGGGAFLACMLLLAGLAIAVGWVRPNPAGPVDLRPWLMLALAGGTPASLLGGAVSRRIARSYRGPALLALLVFCVGLLEATEILRQASAGSAAVPRLLVVLAPVVAAAGVLFGGWLPAKGPPARAAQPPAAADGGRQVRE